PPSRETLEKLLNRRNLSELEAEDLLTQLTDPTGAQAMAGAILAALRTKGVIADEVRGFARGMRRLARRPKIPTDLRAIDVVGTGGDASGSLNISTGTALLTAACGVPVLKHGNRSVSSRAGSADVLEALGLKVPLDEQEAADCLTASNFTFLFAPHYHPAMKAVAPVRAALGVRTIFNILGPLTNPATPPFHLIGAFSLEIARLIAETLSGMEVERTFVVHGAEGWDEPTPIGPFTVFDVRPGKVDMQIRLPVDYGLQTCTAEGLAGGDAQHNARALEAVLTGQDRGPHRDCLLLGTALALEVAGRVRSPQEGVELAASAIDSGKARSVLQSIVSFSKSLAVAHAPASAAAAPATNTANAPPGVPAAGTAPAAATPSPAGARS
ncbi:MAG: anthranilate phosphoribosyltransferase, partial [Gammaproteobacteria bacterium]|nr:anthranilate phosphoribosyltransferase [Gammaproteobacteria bacterium]